MKSAMTLIYERMVFMKKLIFGLLFVLMLFVFVGCSVSTICTICQGSGQCNACFGTGTDTVGDCNQCSGSGTCFKCMGTGLYTR